MRRLRERGTKLEREFVLGEETKTLSVRWQAESCSEQVPKLGVGASNGDRGSTACYGLWPRVLSGRNLPNLDPAMASVSLRVYGVLLPCTGRLPKLRGTDKMKSIRNFTVLLCGGLMLVGRVASGQVPSAGDRDPGGRVYAKVIVTITGESGAFGHPVSGLRFLEFRTWLEMAEQKAKLPNLEGALWHAYRRGWATSRKHLPVSDAAAVGGWREIGTLLKCYTQADADTMLAVMESSKKISERAISG